MPQGRARSEGVNSRPRIGGTAGHATLAKGRYNFSMPDIMCTNGNWSHKSGSGEVGEILSSPPIQIQDPPKTSKASIYHREGFCPPPTTKWSLLDPNPNHLLSLQSRQGAGSALQSSWLSPPCPSYLLGQNQPLDRWAPLTPTYKILKRFALQQIPGRLQRFCEHLSTYIYCCLSIREREEKPVSQGS